MIFKKIIPQIERQTAFITGATGGLGKAFAVECASRGWNLFLTDRSTPALETLAHSLESSYGIHVEFDACNLTNADSRRELFNHIHTLHIAFDALINVAGIDHEGLFLEQPAQQLVNIVRLNIEATLDATRNILPLRCPTNRFTIINVASLAGFYPMPYKATYAASKRFLIDWSLALRQELRNQNVSVTVLCPAGMPTHAECIRSINAQGWVGLITTLDTGRVANLALNAALNGRSVVIPGAVNQLLRILGGLLPAKIVSGFIAKRWKEVRASTSEARSLAALQKGYLPQ